MANPCVSPPRHPVPGPADRRRNVRYATGLEVFHQPGDGTLGMFWRLAPVQDVSAGGVRLVLHRPFAWGTVLALEPKGRDCFGPLLARVVHAVEDGPGEWNTGCAWVHKLGEQELRELLS